MDMPTSAPQASAPTAKNTETITERPRWTDFLTVRRAPEPSTSQKNRAGAPMRTRSTSWENLVKYNGAWLFGV